MFPGNAACCLSSGISEELRELDEMDRIEDDAGIVARGSDLLAGGVVVFVFV